MNGVFYRIARDWCGVKWSRVSSPFTSFGDANREAMRACADKNVRVRVYAFGKNVNGLGDAVAEYAPVNGRAQVVQVDA